MKRPIDIQNKKIDDSRRPIPHALIPFLSAKTALFNPQETTKTPSFVITQDHPYETSLKKMKKPIAQLQNPLYNPHS